LTVTGHLLGFKTLLDKGPCASYAELKEQMQWGNTSVVKAVFSPFSSNKFDARDLRGYVPEPEERSRR
jgi:hypothetical protein